MPDAWHDDDELWKHLAPVLFDRRRWEKAETEVQLLLALVDQSTGAAVLDLPCGQGRHALELARLGFRVTGVDRTESYLQEARRRADANGLRIEWVTADMREFRRPEAFELIINMFTSFGYFQDAADDRLVAENFLRSLKPGGRLVMEMMGRENLAAGFQAHDWHELDDGGFLLEERAIVDHWRGLRNRWILLRGGERHEYEFTLRHYSAGQLIDLLEGAGFDDVTAFGNLEGDPYDEHARRLVVVATR